MFVDWGLYMHMWAAECVHVGMGFWECGQVEVCATTGG